MNILYITFGDNINNHLQAAFSICSFLHAGKNVQSINVLTDAPGFYNHLKEHINIIGIDKEKLEEWKGPYQFFWRIKIKAIHEFAALHAGKPVMYLDTDTFLYNDISSLSTHLRAGRALMHVDEGSLANAKGKTEKNMQKALYQKNIAGILLNDAYHMWNAGVVASPNAKNGDEFALALRLCDEMCGLKVRRRLVEQYALSVALEKTYGLQAADKCIAHYWSNKEQWHRFISDFFLTAAFHGYTTEQTIENFGQLNLSALPVSRIVKNTSLRLQSWVNTLFPGKNAYVHKQNL